ENERLGSIFLKSTALFLLGFWVGLGHEILNVQLFVYFALYLFDRKRLIKPLPLSLTFGLIGLLIGSIILIAAPGNYNRLSVGQEMDFLQRFILSGGYILYVLFLNSYSFWWPWIILIFLMIGLFQKTKNHSMFSSLKSAYNNLSLMFLVAGLFGLLPFLFLSYFYVDRASFFSIAFINIFLLSPLKNLSLQNVFNIKTSLRFRKNIHFINHTFLVLIVIHLVYVISISRNINDELNIRLETIEQQKELGKSNIIVPPLKTKFNRIVYISDITQDTNFWINIDAAKFYGVQTISLSMANQDYSRTKSTILGDYLRKKYRTIIQRHRTSKNN
ncbi:MAG: hypothetical protein JXL97_00485, partial [Bacteroidales bacterium]|nr:hypothetical protein [Bacteroidales bacterium]